MIEEIPNHDSQLVAYRDEEIEIDEDERADDPCVDDGCGDY